jgi:L-asparaginase
VNSDDITDKIWVGRARRSAELQEDDAVDGIVVTHGTDTMDETAYFVSLTVKCEKAVIFTGSMKPATAKNPDGPSNLLGAVRVAVGFAVDDDKPANKVWVYFAGELFDARGVQKCSASALNAMGVDAPGVGACYNAPAERNFFDISRLQGLPQVNIVYFNVDANPKVLKYAACVSDGLVIAGAGSGEFSLAWAEALKEVDIPVVIASRTHHGVVTLNERLAGGCICAGALPPQKAAVLLRLALTVTGKNAVIQKFFA